ncbi:MAG: hypothetical protein COU69_03265 [Candidatus Pacebacteria bacterium CG10_big_fil_rev_8_21_14_0_10_56_10]|nr:MAG: hypothetical protein COU69_03265 [Candidatus Pacebacteria bacterium CG10_big_fil_rev_8_21_14_0_10_56_10]
MPIVVKARGRDNTNDVIKKFKKAAAEVDIVTLAKDRRYHQKPSRLKSVINTERKRLRKKLRSLKRQKNIDPDVISRMTERVGR